MTPVYLSTLTRPAPRRIVAPMDPRSRFKEAGETLLAIAVLTTLAVLFLSMAAGTFWDDAFVAAYAGLCILIVTGRIVRDLWIWFRSRDRTDDR